jgi:LmbE family N-acetylglucosaminyl deacetylase
MKNKIYKKNKITSIYSVFALISSCDNRRMLGKKILCIGAHPDDLELGMGGTVAKHVKSNHEVHLVVCTLGIGGKSGDPKLRRDEAKEGANILGAHLHLIDYPVLDLNKPSRHFTNIIEKLIRSIGPERVYTHSPYDYHQIHNTVGQAVIQGIDNVREVVYYEVLSSTTPDFKPNAYVDITDHIGLKLRSLCAHKSQVARVHNLEHAVKSLAYTRYSLSKIGARPYGMAEAFMIYRLLVLDFDNPFG